MSDNHHYEIEIKQGDLNINLASDDVYFISKQMDKWFKVLLDDSYIPIQISPSKPAPPPKPVIPETPVLEIPLPEPTPEPVVLPEPDPIPEPVKVAPPPEPVLPPPPPPAPPVPVAEPEPVLPPPPPPTPAKPALEIPLPEPKLEPVLPPPPPPPVAAPVTEKLDVAVQDDFEAVMDTLMRDLEKGDSSTYQATSGTLPTPAPASAPLSVIDLSEIETLSELADKAKATSAEDFLLLTAYYLVCIEGHDDKFSLKRINSQLVKSGMTPVNHSVLESAITKNYLTLVPDLTGMADVSEYSLSDAGQAYVLKLFA